MCRDMYLISQGGSKDTENDTLTAFLGRFSSTCTVPKALEKGHSFSHTLKKTNGLPSL